MRPSSKHETFPGKARHPASGPTEAALISAIRERAAAAVHGRLRLGIGDDCAILRPRPGDEIVVTTDLSLEQIHFRRDWHPAPAVGHRCLARGLSDLAAMGATPLAAFLSLAIPPELARKNGRGPSWMDRFLDGLFQLAEAHHVPLAGGDLARSPRGTEGVPLAAGDLARSPRMTEGVPLEGGDLARSPRGTEGVSLVTADIVLLGSVPRGSALLRSTARAGDTIYVTGNLGGAAAELLALERTPLRFRTARPTQPHPHLYPQPRLEIGSKLRAARWATAAIDLSDGLSTDLAHLCEASALAAEIDASAIPIHIMASIAERAAWVPSALALALNGGEDYELLFTAAPSTRIPRRIAGIPIHPIGRMTPRSKGAPIVTLRSGTRRQPLNPAGWQHF